MLSSQVRAPRRVRRCVAAILHRGALVRGAVVVSGVLFGACGEAATEGATGAGGAESVGGTDGGGTSTAGGTAAGGSGGSGKGAAGAGGGSAGAGPGSGGSTDEGGDFDFQERDGKLVFEAEHFRTKTSAWMTQWVTFEPDTPVFTDCPAQSTCPGDPLGNCNPYDDCDDDHHAAGDQSGEAYVEVLPNRRRTDHEAGTGTIGVSNNPQQSPQLWYRVKFNTSGTYYAWVRGYGKGPADNGLHLAVVQKDTVDKEDFSPDYGLPDYAGLRWQFKNGWKWQNCRRGSSQHTGVNGCEVTENMLIQIPAPGIYDIVVAMREDGVDIDKFYFSLTTETPADLGPSETK